MSNYNLEKILPHSHPMILIDDIVEYNIENQYLISKVTINDKKLFFDKTLDGIPGCVGIEFMAQTIGCYAYFKQNQEPPRIGFLLGARLMNCAVDKFENGKTYTIKSREVFTNNEIVAFDCIIYNENGDELASSTVNTYQEHITKEESSIHNE